MSFEAHVGSPRVELRRDLRTGEVFVQPELARLGEIIVHDARWARWVTDAQLHRFKSWRFDVREGTSLTDASHLMMHSAKVRWSDVADENGFVHGVIRGPLGR